MTATIAFCLAGLVIAAGCGVSASVLLRTNPRVAAWVLGATCLVVLVLVALVIRQLAGPGAASARQLPARPSAGARGACVGAAIGVAGRPVGAGIAVAYTGSAALAAISEKPEL